MKSDVTHVQYYNRKYMVAKVKNLIFHNIFEDKNTCLKCNVTLLRNFRNNIIILIYGFLSIICAQRKVTHLENITKIYL
jgi:hypothetical protein